MRRFRKILLWTAVVLAVFTVVGFFVVPPILKSVLVDKMSQTLHRSVAIREITVNPYTLRLAVRGLDIKEPSGGDTFVSFDELSVKVDSLSLFKRALLLKEIGLVKPYARILRHPDGSYNFSDLIKKDQQTETKDQQPAEPLKFSLNNIRIEQGSLDFWDGPKNIRHSVQDLRVAVPSVSNMPYLIEQYVQPMVSARINGTPYVLEGKTKPFQDTLETSFDFDIKDIDIPFYLAYVPVDLNFKLLSGTLDTKVNVAYVQLGDKAPSLVVKGDVALKNLAVDQKKGQRLLRLPLLQVSMASVEPLAGSFHFAKIALDAPELVVKRSAAGELNLLTILPKGKEKGREPTKAVEKGKEPAGGKEKPSPAPNVLIDALLIEKGKVSFNDEQPSTPVHVELSRISLEGKQISTAKNIPSTLNLSFRLGKKGAVSVTGPFTVDPLSANWTLKLDGIDIPTFQGYFTDRVKVTVTAGDVSAAGRLTLAQSEKAGLTTGYAGKCQVVNFKTIDKVNAEDVLNWKSLYFTDIRFASSPASLGVRQIALNDFYVRLVINDDGTLNLQNIVVQQDTQAAPPKGEKGVEAGKAKGKAAEKEPSQVVKIDALTLQGGTIEFQDRMIKPAYAAKLVEIGGRVVGLSSEKDKPAEVELRGKLDQYAPLEITGKVHPLRKDLFVDLKTSFKDMDLSPVSPYTGKYAGHAIQKGKLSFDLKYLIADGKLEAENKVFVDQLTLGNKVDSPQATKLPVGLAIALLKDRNGQIRLDIPVAGSLDDPKFSVWRIILQVLVNLATKAATAPFALLGSLFGGGEELSYVEFGYGAATLADADMKKIKTLSQALYERPTLNLEIEGFADPEGDREGLKRFRFERKLKARKLTDLVKQGLPAVPVDEVKIETAEYGKYLTLAYQAETFPKPRNVVGMAKSLPAAEMEKLMLTYTVIKDEDLRLLAAQRAAAVKDLLLKTGEVKSERLFILEPKSLTPEKKEKLKNSRVDFKLK